MPLREELAALLEPHIDTAMGDYGSGSDPTEHIIDDLLAKYDVVPKPEPEECHHTTRRRIGGDATFITWKCLLPNCGEEWTEARD